MWGRRKAPRAYADEPDVEVGVYHELGGVSVFFVDREDRCLESRFWDLVDGDRKPNGPWWLMTRTWTAYKDSEPTLIVEDRYGHKGHVERRQTDAPNGIEVTVSFRPRLDDGERVLAKRSEDFVRELLALPTPGDAMWGERRDVRNDVRLESGYRKALLLRAQQNGWPSEKERILRRWLLGGVPHADLRWLLSQLGRPLEKVVGEVVRERAREGTPKRIEDLVRAMESFPEVLDRGIRA